MSISYLSILCPINFCPFNIIGSIETDYTEENVRIGNYPLSAALTCTKICSAFEEAWGVF